jgi:DDE family transposase/DDE superfamily endonuclease
MRLLPAILRPTAIATLTGLSVKQFGALLERLWARRPDGGRGRPWALPFADRVLLVTLAYRTNLTERQLAALFGVGPATAHRVIADLAPALAALLGPPPRDRRELWLVDGTLIPVHDHTRAAVSKNYRRSVNVQVVCRARDRRVVAVGTARPGNRNDVTVFRETLAARIAATGHRRLAGDGGYRGAPGVASPRRGPGQFIIRDRAWRRFVRRRAVIEHLLAGVKDWQVLRCCRRHGTGIDLAVAGVAALHNLRLEIT